MGLLSGTRGIKNLSFVLLALFALTGLLATLAPVSTGPIGATTAWATGSPDETLGPGSTPKATQAPSTTYDQASGLATTTTTKPTYTWTDYLLLTWKYLTVTRF